MTSTSEQRQRYRRKYPEKVKEQRQRYYERKILKLIEEKGNIKEYELKLVKGFHLITRVKFNNILPKKCEKCGSIDNLEIHHIKYIYPIKKEDLKRLCKKCHIEEHQTLP